MVKKRKSSYKNFNICQLVDKGKLKLQYLDEFKESKKILGIVNKKFEHEDKKDRIQKGTINHFENLMNPLQFQNDLYDIINTNRFKNNFSLEFIKNYCKFVEIQNKSNDTNFFAILILDKYGLLIDGPKFNGNNNFIIINKEEIYPYLISFDMIKNEYNLDDIKEIFNRYLECKNEKNKKLVKEK